MPKRDCIYLLGYASSMGGPDPIAGEGPLLLRHSPYLMDLQAEIPFQWHSMITPDPTKSKVEGVLLNNLYLASSIADLVQKDEFFVVFGGDHTCAIGTWSGAAYAMEKRGAIGLIWIDAHMDSHTPETTLTGNLHGMPLACLLGHGNPAFTHLLSAHPKIKPEHLCLIGIRSYEPAERELLERLKVRIFYMDEIERRGLNAVMQEALAIATHGTVAYGVSLDIDSIDPEDAPATDVSEAGGLRAHDLLAALPSITADPRLLGIEITEFDPHRDIDHKTEKLIPALMKAMIKN